MTFFYAVSVHMQSAMRAVNTGKGKKGNAPPGVPFRAQALAMMSLFFTKYSTPE